MESSAAELQAALDLCTEFCAGDMAYNHIWLWWGHGLWLVYGGDLAYGYGADMDYGLHDRL